MKVLIGPYNGWIDDGGEKAATDETIMILPYPLSIIPERKIFVIAMTEIPRTLINFSSSSFDQTPMEEEEKFIRVLGISVIALCKLFIKDMLDRGKGRIMIISSVAAYAPPSSIQTLYGPIKTFMNRFSEGLNLNYNHRGITSTAVCPGYTITNFHSASGVQNEMDNVPGFMKKDAPRVAEEAVQATLKGNHVYVPTKTFKVIVLLLKIIPHSFFSLVSSVLAPGRYDSK